MARKKNDESGEETKDTLPAAAPTEEPTATPPKVEVAPPPPAPPPPPTPPPPEKVMAKKGSFIIMHEGVAIGTPEVDRMLAIRQAQKLAAEGKCDLSRVQIAEV
jgi:pyruvate/2-oxoglutarate dehydrogenase complex dihydrolipoamide acyltransferase (E2) component